MKISVVCICIFLFCTLYWAFGTSQGFASAEIPDFSTTITQLVIDQENASTSETITSNNDEQHDAVTNNGELKESSDIEPSIETVANEPRENVQRDGFAFIEAVSQNSAISHEITGTNSGAIHTMVDAATLELQEKAEELATTATSTPLPATTSHHNDTLETNNLTTEEKSIVNDSLTDLAKSGNLSVEIKLEEKSNEISDNNNNTEQTDQAATEVPSIEPKSNVTEEEGKGGGTHEDIPSFSEWAQKQLEEAERKKEQSNSSDQSHQANGKTISGMKKRWKNYASPDCGAKIIAANPEAVSSWAVLTALRDEYKLNACTNRIWFIVELCEAIQAKKIDLANFELFSSSPQDFTISVSDRFPTRDWSSVGQFTAKDERDIQSFDLHPHLFGKYIKFEMHSHHGSEHYCPISLFRVYGTSEFEVLETENRLHANVAEDEEDEDAVSPDDGHVSKNLFSSATDAVLSIVKKAAEVLGNKGNTSINNTVDQNLTAKTYTPLISTCTTPSHLVVCDNCSDLLFGNVFELLSCNSKRLVQLATIPLIKNTLQHTNVCSKFGLEFRTSQVLANIYKSYLESFFPSKYVAALCNTMAVTECKVVLNVSSSNATTAQPQDIEKIVTTQIPEPTVPATIDPTTTTPQLVVTETPPDEISTPTHETNFSENLESSQINPTKTFSSEDINLTYAPVTDKLIQYDHPTFHSTSSSGAEVQNNESIGQEQSIGQALDPIEMGTEGFGDVESTTESAENIEENLDSLGTDFNGEGSLNVPASTVSPPTPQGQKESVFLRLSNRIKVLERNMSLSSQYLEELSRRYKKQVEEMQRLLDKTINTLSEESKRKDEKTQQLEEQIMLLKEAVENLIEEKNSWMHTTYWVFLSGALVIGTLLFCRRNPEHKRPNVVENKEKNNEIHRRKSLDVFPNKTPVKKKRRPSEEAAMVSGSYAHLLIDEVDSNEERAKEKAKRKKRRNQLQRSNSITTVNEEPVDNDERACRTVHSDRGLYFAPKMTSTQIWKRQESAPPKLPLNWVNDSFHQPNTIQEIPFVLEESEHSSLEPFSSIPVLHENVALKENGNAIISNTYTVTATDTRSRRLFSRTKSANGKSKGGHRKSASFDETQRHHQTPSPSGTDTTSLSNNFDDSFKLASEIPRKEKRSGFRRFFRNLNFK